VNARDNRAGLSNARADISAATSASIADETTPC
jgi:hypothetical protein